MKKETLIAGFFYVILCGLLIVFSPDGLSMVFVIAQSIMMLVGFIFGIFRVSRFSRSFQIARANIYRLKDEIQTDKLWTAISHVESFFQLEVLDREFEAYKSLVSTRKRNPNTVLPDIEDTFNEDMVSIKIWRSAVNQVPETLTGIGILGTFVGLIIGIGGIGFSSVAAAITSLQTLINGIEIAFYTSIVGLILSICFNLTYKFCWNILIRDMFLFVDDFHKNVIPSEESQMKELQVKYYTSMLKYFGGPEAQTSEAQTSEAPASEAPVSEAEANAMRGAAGTAEK